MTSRKIASSILLILSLFMAKSVLADSYSKYVLSGTFSNNNVLTGSLTFDTVTQLYTSFNIIVKSSNDTILNTFTQTNSAYNNDPLNPHFETPTHDYLKLAFDRNIGTAPTLIIDYAFYAPYHVTGVFSYNGTAQAVVPEPEMISMFAIGLLGLGIASRNKISQA